MWEFFNFVIATAVVNKPILQPAIYKMKLRRFKSLGFSIFSVFCPRNLQIKDRFM